MLNAFFRRGCLVLGFLSLIAASVHAQMKDPVDWSFSKEKLSEGEYELHFKADIDKGWHLYSQNLPEDATPLPTVFEFEKDEGISLRGKVHEIGVVTEPDPISGNKVNFFKEEAHFIQKVKATGSGKKELSGSVEYMVCDDSQCLPPTGEEFSFELTAAAPSRANGKEPDNEKEDGAAKKEGADEEDTKGTGMLDPVDWTGKVLRLEKGRYVLQLRASIDSGWHIYGRSFEGSGPVPTRIAIDSGKGIALVGKLWEEEPKEKFDEQFQSQVTLYEKEALFEQVFDAKRTGEGDSIEARIEYMACTDEKCLRPRTIERGFALSGATDKEPELVDPEKLGERERRQATSSSNGDKDKARGLLLTFILSFGGGFLALLTPCVFPMIPLTVSFFTKQSPTRAKGIRNAIVYSASIVLIYTSVGYLVTLIFGGSAMNVISTNPWVNVMIFVLIVIFAISFLGAFELTLPESWINRSDRMADKGGLIGIFFMAFVLSLVSFSCTAPIIGPLVFQTASQGGIAPAVGMAGFSLALALPFGLFAVFPAWLNSLPQSGGWMNTVKVTLGFLELALAFKFLSNADLVLQAGLLKRELFLAIMIGIFGMMSLYLLGLFRTPNDDEVPKLSVPRVLIATLSLVFTLYLIPGLFGAPLKMISGFPPPLQYSEWSRGMMAQGSEDGGSGTMTPEGGWGKECPMGLNCLNDYEKALAYAKKVDKPLMLDFTGHACANCRRMEETVWTEGRIMDMIRNDVVLASLYVDERSDLPEKEQKTVTLNGEEMELESVGDKWHYFQAKHYRTNTQPYYVLLDHQEQQLIEPTGYEPNVEEYAAWLERGIRKFKEGS
jgi:thiol:disulfide interchange protein DsbD